MSKITLASVGNLVDVTTAQTTINNNFSTIQTAFDNTLSRDGTSPNTLSATLDTNSNRIINLPTPVGVTEPLRLQDLNDFLSNEVVAGTNIIVTGAGTRTVSTVMNPNFTTSVTTPNLVLNGTSATGITGTGNLVGSTSPVLVTPTIGAATATSINKIAITAPATSATLTIANGKTLTANNTMNLSSTDSANLVFQTSDTYVGRTTTDTLTNKSISGATNTLSAIPVSAIAAQAANTIVANPTAGSASPTAVDISTLTTKASPAVSDYLLLSDQAASGAFKKVTVGSVSSASGPVTSFNTLTGAVTSNIVNQVFTANGTYTPTSGMLHCIVRCVGGGGGGGNSTGGATQISAGGGGGAGGYAEGRLTAAQIGASKAVVIGAAGAANGAGGDTTLGSTLVVAKGGLGGANGAANSGGAGGLGGISGTGDLTFPGSPGQGGTGSSSVSTAYAGPMGASSHFGAGGAGLGAGSAANGNAGLNYGSGGGGAVTYASASGFTGGAGTAGIMIITEYINL